MDKIGEKRRRTDVCGSSICVGQIKVEREREGRGGRESEREISAMDILGRHVFDVKDLLRHSQFS